MLIETNKKTDFMVENKGIDFKNNLNLNNLFYLG